MINNSTIHSERLFIAILPDENFRQSLIHTQNVIKRHSVKGTFTKHENFHLTLIFIGETTLRPKITVSLDEVRSSVFYIELSHSGVFEKNGGDIIWAGLKNTGHLKNLHRDLSLQLRAAGVPIDNRSFNAHITLGRRVKLHSGFNPVNLPINKAIMSVKKISLMRSENIKGELIYAPVYSKPLETPST